MSVDLYPGSFSDAGNDTNVSLWPYAGGLAGEIDLRNEFHKFLYGDGVVPPRGHWIVLRKNDTSKKSEYWDEEYREAVGGPAYEYTDYLMRARKVVVTSAGALAFAEQKVPPGIIEVPFVVFYIEHMWNPTTSDEIFEFEGGNTSSAITTVDESQYKDRYNITLPIPHFGDEGGRIEYWRIFCKRELSKW